MSDQIKSIVVIGNDEHAWSAAAALVVGLKGQSVAISVVDNEADLVPQIISLGITAHEFHRRLGISESALMARVPAAYSYGLDVLYNRPSTADFRFVYTPMGRLIKRVQFHHYLVRMRSAGGSVTLSDYSLAAQAADRGVFSHPQPDSALSAIEYSVNVERLAYIRLLKAAVLQTGVRFIDASLKQVEKDAQGDVTALALGSGETLTPDFVIDTRNAIDNPTFQAVLGEQQADYQVCAMAAIDEKTPVINQLQLAPDHSIGSLAIPGVRFHRLSYHSKTLDHATAAQALAKRSGILNAEAFKAVSNRVGYATEPWRGNVLSLGAASVNMEGELFCPLYHTHTAMQRWLALYPRKKAFAQQIEQFNREAQTEYAHVRDAHHALLGQFDATETLAYRVHLFSETGRVAFYESDVLEPLQWVNLLLAKGVWPKRCDPLLNSVSESEIIDLLKQEAQAVSATVSQFPAHDSLLQAIKATV